MKHSRLSLLLLLGLLLVNCSSTKGIDGNLPATHGNLKGTWTVSDIQIDLPAGFNVTKVFNTAPYEDFRGSTWELIRNGKGSFTLSNGTKEEIYWTITGDKSAPQFQFKILDGEKARNVEEGYRLAIQGLNENSFKAMSSVQFAEGKTGAITYTFTRKI